MALAPVNRLVLSGKLIERRTLRYTPAGIAALDLRIAHQSEVSEDGVVRKVTLEIAAVALGRITQVLSTLALDAEASYAGFLSAGRNGRGLVFHITEVDIARPESR